VTATPTHTWWLDCASKKKLSAHKYQPWMLGSSTQKSIAIPCIASKWKQRALYILKEE
jgi:hypothetical protein